MKIGKNVKINYSDPQKAHPWCKRKSTKRRLMTIHPPAWLVGEPKKTKKKERKEGKKEERHPRQWQTGYSPRPPTSSDQNQTLHGGWPAVCSYTCQVWSKSVKGLRRCGVENGPSPLLWPSITKFDQAYTTACTTVQAVILSESRWRHTIHNVNTVHGM